MAKLLALAAIALAATVAAVTVDDEPTAAAVRTFVAGLNDPGLELPGKDEPCAFARVAGRQQGVLCHGIMYDLTVPAQCLEHGRRCGVVVDVHGLSMNGTWEEALTAMGAHGARIDCLTLQPSSQPAGLGPGPPWTSWRSGDECAAKALAGLDDVEAAFAVDARRVYLAGLSEGGDCANSTLNRADGAAARFGAIVIGGNGASLPRAPLPRVSWMWTIGRYDTLTGVQPGVVEPRLAQYTAAWNLTTHELVESGAMFEHHRWSNPDAADGVEIEYMVHNYTLRGETVIGAYTAGHCAPGGTDAPPNAPWAYFGRFPLRLSCPQPDPTVAEQGVAGQTWSAFFDRHLARGV